jgi:hypothetical protein
MRPKAAPRAFIVHHAVQTAPDAALQRVIVRTTLRADGVVGRALCPRSDYKFGPYNRNVDTTSIFTFHIFVMEE